MTAAVEPVPARRSDLLIREVAPGKYVVKHSLEASYFRLGPVEHFLLLCLDGKQTAEDVCKAFESRFGEPLSPEELDEFIGMMRKQNLIAGATAAPSENAGSGNASTNPDEEDDLGPTHGKQSWLYFRRSLFDPDRFLSRIAPPLWWIWTPGFVVFAACLLLCALSVAGANRGELFSSLPAHLGWGMWATVWVTVITVTMLHEVAHGLTCKHFGGEVREIGVLMIFFTPCLYCNVSDAWLMPKRSHRLWITFAGGFCDMVLWSLAIFVWRFTHPVSLVNQLAWIVMSVCSGRILINLNPFTRMDGYYLLTDIIEVPNLRPQARAYFMEHVRWLLWGAEKPAPRPSGRPLLGYGIVVWAFSLLFLNYILYSIFKFATGKSGIAGIVVTCVLTTYAFRRVFRGFLASEFTAMLKTRPFRTACWATGVVLVPVVLFTVTLQATATGEFEIRPAARVEVHSPIAGFLHRVLVEEGQMVRRGQPIAELTVPDLPSLIVRKEAEIRETSATLTRLRAGTRPEMLEEQRHRVQRAEEWVSLAERDLAQAKVSLSQDLLKHDLELKQYAMEIDFAKSSVARAEFLFRQEALAGEQLRSEKKKVALLESQLAQVEAQRKAREADGVRTASAEVERRKKEVAEAKAAMTLLEAGSRPEEIDAEAAKLSRLEEELKFLKDQQSHLVIVAPSDGIVATPRMAEKVGQLADKGVLICVLDDPKTMQIEILVPEDDVPGVSPQQSVHIKSRALPFDHFTAVVDRIAPTAVLEAGRKQNTVRVYCHVDNDDGRLKSGMTGFARIVRGQQSAATFLWTRALKVVRTEFWW